MADTLSFDPVSAVSGAVSSVADAVSKFSPSEEKKAVNAAEDAGKAAQKQVKKMLPKCETNLEFKKKIVPLNLPNIDNRAQYNFFRTKTLNDVYKQAYDQVMALYRSRITGIPTYTAQEQLQQDSQQEFQQNENKFVSTGGCLGVSAVLIGVTSALTALVYYLVNFV